MTTRASQLVKKIKQSPACQLLIPTYRDLLLRMAVGNDIANQKALGVLLRQENPAELQSVFFIEDRLQNFIQTHLSPPSDENLLSEYRLKAGSLIQSFIIFTPEEKREVLEALKNMNLSAVRKLIDLYRYAHHKQHDYLQLLAVSDPDHARQWEKIISSNLTN